MRKLHELVKGHSRIEVKEVMTKYPQGGERTLIYATTGREINSSMLPADAGCVVDNIDTVVAVYKAVILGRPVMNRIVTVTGDAIAESKKLYGSYGDEYGGADRSRRRTENRHRKSHFRRSYDGICHV